MNEKEIYEMLKGADLTDAELNAKLKRLEELESENERLRLERDVLIGKKIVENQKYDNALVMKIDIQEQLKARIAELEDKIENGRLREIPEGSVVLTEKEYNKLIERPLKAMGELTCDKIKEKK
jgi:tetrahydromethanopterin S-methyltransferase subunit G